MADDWSLVQYDADALAAVEPRTEDGLPQVLPRRVVYASPEAEAMGLRPMEDYPTAIVKPADFKDVIAYCHEHQVFPMYWRKASSLPQTPSQNGLGHCWNYGLTHCVEDVIGSQGAAYVKLAPNSLAWLVNWRNQGYFLAETIAGARDRGIAPASMVPEYNLNPRSFQVGWEQEALKYRPLEVWDTNRRDGEEQMLAQMLTILATGRPCYIAFNWWGHALAIYGMQYDASKPWNVRVVLFNSHQDGLIELYGQKSVPDEAYGIGSVSIAA